MKNMKLVQIGICLIGLVVFNTAVAKNWYANTFDNKFITKLVNGQLSKEKVQLKEHLDKFINYDIKDDNFPYDKKLIYKHFEELVSRTPFNGHELLR